jgi:hypothetical protein
MASKPDPKKPKPGAAAKKAAPTGRRGGSGYGKNNKRPEKGST